MDNKKVLIGILMQGGLTSDSIKSSYIANLSISEEEKQELNEYVDGLFGKEVEVKESNNMTFLSQTNNNISNDEYSAMDQNLHLDVLVSLAKEKLTYPDDRVYDAIIDIMGRVNNVHIYLDLYDDIVEVQDKAVAEMDPDTFIHTEFHKLYDKYNLI